MQELICNARILSMENSLGEDKKRENLHFLNKLDQIDCYLPLTTHFYILIFQFIIGV